MERTGYTKIDRIIEQARAAGLEVEVARECHENELLGTQVSVSVNIRHPRLAEVANALELVNQSDRIHLYWCWYVGNGCTPHLLIARQSGYSGTEHKLRAKMVKYAVRTMGESLARQNQES